MSSATPLMPDEWCRDQDSNQGHTDFQSVALPTELSRHLSLKLFNSLIQSSASRKNNPELSLPARPEKRMPSTVRGGNVALADHTQNKR